MNKKNIKRVINWQKIFCFVSFIFILVCCLWYGGRFVYFYLDSNKTSENDEDANLSSTILNNDNNSIQNINNSYYFVGDVSNNYVRYSNILWRIIKIDNEDKVYLISDDVITMLAYGENISDYSDSYISNWLNDNGDDYSGILENNLNNINTYLSTYNVCIDKIDDANNIGCDDKYNDDYIGLLSIVDYINTGGSDSFINNGKNIYLANETNDNKVWYINSDGKLDTSDGDDIYGVKPVISLNSNIKSTSGDGSLDNPYVIDNEESLFGGYVRLGDDIWRIYEDNDENVKMMLNDYIIIDDEELSYIYSENNYYHNDTVYGSLAYYLNHTYLDSLSYSDIIITNYYSNGYYNNDYDYSEILDSTIDTKVSVISVGNVIFNNEMDNYWTNTGTNEEGERVYMVKNSGTLSTRSVSSSGYVVPCISINKDILVNGNGTIDSPYEME